MVWVLAGGSFVNCLGSPVVPFLVPYLVHRGYGAGVAAGAVSAYAAGKIVAGLAGGVLTDRLGAGWSRPGRWLGRWWPPWRWPPSAVTVLVNLILFQAQTTLPLWVHHLGLPTSSYGPLLALNSGLLMILQLPAARLTARWHPPPSPAPGWPRAARFSSPGRPGEAAAAGA